MKKFLLGTVVAAAFLPAFALAAAYNDVTLTTATILSVNGITINVTSTAYLSQIVTDATTFSLTLAPNSTIYVTAPNRNKLALSPAAPVSQTTTHCDDSSSSFTLTAAPTDATTTVVVTPSATLCANSSASSSSGGSGGNGPLVVSSSGGGGGSIAATTPTATQTTTATGNTGTIAALQAQLNALLAQIAVLKGNANPSANAYANANSNASFKRSLTVGSIGADVKALQMYINAHGFVLAKNGAGSPGKETTKFGGLTRAALAKWQKSVGIKPASGYFGPKTRAYIAAHP